MSVEGVDEGSRSSSVVLIIHGVLTSLKAWEPIISPLSQHFRVIGMNLRGHGGSEALERPYAPEDLAGDVVSFVREVNAHKKGIFLIGHSLGSAIGLQIMTEKLLKIEKAILISATPKFQLRAFVDMVSNSAALFRQIAGESSMNQNTTTTASKTFREALRTLLISLGTTTEAIKDTFSNITENPLFVISKIIQDFIVPWEVDRSRLADILTPVLIVAGENDPVIPAQRSAELLSLIPNAELKIINKGTHFLPTENPKEILDLAIGFFT